MLISRSALLVALGAALGACKDSTNPAGDTGRLRVVNSVFQGASVAGSVPVAVDVLVDSSTNGGLSGLAALTLSPGNASGQGAGTHAGAAVLFTAAGYRDLPSGVHTFVARVNGTSGPTSSFFRSGQNEYLPRQYMFPFPYTFVLAGVVPPNGTAPDPSAVTWAMIVDDPFTPPTDAAGGLTARVQVINAAPMADTTGAGQGTSVASSFDNGAGGVFTVAASSRS